ncbi:hypothetical protein [Luteibacter sp. 3190]|uniref:hypothetical protein n=1 Tax=Luteibacter sp. 3190 TaxID=2817736 RepID=UPI002861162A|nr:hypothetical protein [Luteibacter sp. 3190]MDR6937459.1 hypothetical protein [Luteibacter sp. 3190]
MKPLRTAFVVACLAVPAPYALGADTHPAPAPLIGTWSLDTSRLPMPPDQRPKSVTFRFAEAGVDRLTTQVDIVYAPGQEVHSTSTTPLDGTYVVIENSPEADHVALRKPTPNVLVMALQKDGVLVSTRTYAVTPDGRNLVETVVYPGTERDSAMRANYFTRVR